MQRERCPDCEKTYLHNISCSKNINNRQSQIVIGKYCPLCHFTKYTDSDPPITLSTKQPEKRSHSTKFDYIDKLEVVDRVTPLTMKQITNDAGEPKNLKELRKSVRENIETRAILKRIAQKDEDVKALLDSHASVEEIERAVVLRELKAFSTEEINRAVSRFIPLGSEGLTDEEKLERLYRLDSYDKVVSYMKGQQVSHSEQQASVSEFRDP